MHNPTSGTPSRQVRRAAQRRLNKARRQAERQRDKELRQAERRRQRATLALGFFEEALTLAERLARPGDRLRVTCASGLCAEWLGLPNDGEVYPVRAELVRGGSDEAEPPEASP
jgi:hypothetical protein